MNLSALPSLNTTPLLPVVLYYAKRREKKTQIFSYNRKNNIGHVGEGRKKWRWKQWIISPEQSAPQINSNKKTGGESLTPAQLVNVPDVTMSCLAASPADTEMEFGMMAPHPGGNLGLDAFWIPNQWCEAASKMLKDPDNYQKRDRWHDTPATPRAPVPAQSTPHLTQSPSAPHANTAVLRHCTPQVYMCNKWMSLTCRWRCKGQLRIWHGDYISQWRDL